MTGSPALVSLLAATTLHLGFQLTVTVLVYPALARVPVDQWSQAHARHSRAIVPIVAVTYASLLTSVGWSVATAPLTAGLLVAAAGVVLALGTTAAVAAPLHGRLGRDGPADKAIRRLLAADRVRTAGAVLATAGAVLALVQPGSGG